MFAARENFTRSQQGMSLIELLIAMIIGMLLTAGAIQLFISNKATYKIENSLSRLQETGRFVVEAMAREIRMAGYNGCSSRGNITPNVIANNPPPLAFNNDNAVLGYNMTGVDSWTPAIPGNLLLSLQGIDSDGEADGDVINIMRMDECGASVSGNWEVTNANVKVSYPNTCEFDQNMAVMVTDCQTADIFQITSNPNDTPPEQTLTHSNAVNTGNFLGTTYGPDSQISVPRSSTFFIAPGANGEPSIFMAWWLSTDNDNTVDIDDFDVRELAEGVEDLQILYGIDNAAPDEYADTYVTADAVTDWTTVRSVRVNLLLRSEDRVTEEPRTITFNGATVGGGDNRLRMIYTATVSVRNRLP